MGGPASELDRSAQCMHIVFPRQVDLTRFNVRSTGSGDSPVEINLVGSKANLAKTKTDGGIEPCYILNILYCSHGVLEQSFMV